MPINYPRKGGKLNSQRESDEALREGKTTLMAHTRSWISDWHMLAKAQNYWPVGAGSCTPKTEYHVRTWDSIAWLSFSGVKKAYGSIKMSRFRVVMNGVRLKDKRLSDSAGSHTVWALSFGVLASVLKSMCDVYVCMFEWGFLVYITCFMVCMCLQIRKQARLWHQRLFFSSVLNARRQRKNIFLFFGV